MRQNLRLCLGLVVLLAAMPLLSACYTAQGAGQDLQAAGQKLSNSADRNTTYKP